MTAIVSHLDQNLNEKASTICKREFKRKTVALPVNPETRMVDVYRALSTQEILSLFNQPAR